MPVTIYNKNNVTQWMSKIQNLSAYTMKTYPYILIDISFHLIIFIFLFKVSDL